MATKLYIDISKYQTNVDYQEIAKHIDGVILRVGFTGWGALVSQKDPLFEKHYEGFRAAGVPIGVYWYSCASTEAKAIKEAELTLKYIKGKKIELPVWFDSEDTHHQKPLSKAALTKVADAFCRTIEKAGYYTGIYASTSWLNTELDMIQLSKYDVWVAHYGVQQPTYKRAYGMWQYTSDGSLKGYSGRLDMNKVYRDYPELIRKNKLNHLSEDLFYPVPENWDGISIKEGLKKIGVDSSFGFRTKIANANGIYYYTGLASQNIKLCQLLNNGELLKV